MIIWEAIRNLTQQFISFSLLVQQLQQLFIPECLLNIWFYILQSKPTLLNCELWFKELLLICLNYKHFLVQILVVLVCIQTLNFLFHRHWKEILWVWRCCNLFLTLVLYLYYKRLNFGLHKWHILLYIPFWYIPKIIWVLLLLCLYFLYFQRTSKAWRMV